MTRRRTLLSTLKAAALLCGLSCATAFAHEGPPYPILVDDPIPGFLVDVWGDPDVGTGTFYIILEPSESGPPVVPARVDVWVQPVSKRLEPVTYPAAREETDQRIQFLAEPRFDRQERWTVGFVIHHPHGKTSELITEVEVTPPGYGAWDLVIYLIPFLLFGGLWCLALLRRWRTSARNDSEGVKTPKAPYSE